MKGFVFQIPASSYCCSVVRSKAAITEIDQPMKAVKKENLPSKICAHCLRPFTWRKKWEKVWSEVKYCSDRCRNCKNSPNS
ncbi:DUF2256 domain-containing protein [Pedobacter sp. GSP4]|uniref:DUF2256 domain-containing protein n=1 Tax=Pedobacter sp. GSP4 TaxID=3453716 RepID=UPI003EEFB931